MRLKSTHLKVLLPSLLLLSLILFIGCSEEGTTDPVTTQDPVDDLEDNDTADVLRTPSAAQMTLDLPASLVTEAGKSDDDGPPCDDLDFPGPVFVCVTKYILGTMAVGMVDNVAEMMDEVMTGVVEGELPAGQAHVFTVEEEDMVISILWEDGDLTDEFHLTITGATSGNVMADWDWEIDADDGASGIFQITNELMEADHGEAHEGGLYLEFSSNADGSEKSIFLDMAMGEDPPEDDLSAPTSLRINAQKDADGWTLQYGMYHPTWFGETVETSVETYLLVAAVGGLENDDPGVMKVIAVPGDVTTLPADVDETYSICSFADTYSQDQGFEWDLQCGDDNPVYVEGDGTITTGGEPPAGLEDLAADLADLSYVTTNLPLIRDIAIEIEDPAK